MLILQDTDTKNGADENCCEPETGRDLLMKMFHRGGTKEDEEADPERGSLKGDRFVGFFSAFFCVIGLEDHRVKKEREKTEDEKELDKEDDQVFGMMLDPAAGLQGNDLIDIVEVDAAGK